MNEWKLKRRLPNLKNQEVVNEFLLSLKLMNRSKGTIIQYRDYLERFFLVQEQPFDELSADTILQWIREKEAHLQEKTLSQRLSILSSFYNFCVQEEYMEFSPMKSRWNPRLPKPIPKFMEKEDIAKTRFQSEMTPVRNQAMVEFMLSSGCWVGELHRLDRTSVDLENRTAHVIGKGGKIRQVHFSEKCAVLLERYIPTRKKDAEALFVASTGKRLGINCIYKIVRKLGEEAGVLSFQRWSEGLFLFSRRNYHGSRKETTEKTHSASRCRVRKERFTNV